MTIKRVICGFCGKKFSRPLGRFNEAKKFSWRQFCSLKCQNQSKLTRIERRCANPLCGKKIFREAGQFKKSKSGRIFCSCSCAAAFNNLPRKKNKTCPVCNKEFYGERKYCSNLCRSKVVSPRKKSKSEKQMIVLDKIKTFYNINGRIPIKRERPGLARAAQAIFGTWNNAIQTAGFEPNPVMFAKKYIGNDGHKCDSLAEKIIDDWLYSKRILHERAIPYSENKLLSVDFVANNRWIEFLGLAGVIKRYDQLVKEKRRLCKKYNLSLIEIYPKDLFPINRLEEILKI